MQRIDAALRRDLSGDAMAAAARELRRAGRYASDAAGTPPRTGEGVVDETS